MNKFNCSVLAAAFTLALSGAAFANDPDPQETGDPMPNEPITQTATDMPMTGDRSHPSFADLDTDADGFVSVADIPAENELSLQFALADTDQDARLSEAEFDAYQTAPEEEEAEE
jgi:hypothetical protein